MDRGINFFDLIWDKEFSKVNRMISDSHPYQIIKGDNKDTIIINALGIKEDDIKIELKPSKYDDRTTYLVIEGETENDITNTKYSISNRFSINKLKVKKIEYGTKDGLLYIDVVYNEEPEIEIPISKYEEIPDCSM